MTIPKTLQCQMTTDYSLKISNMCCQKMKKEPIHLWEKANNKSIALTGMRADEGGTRSIIKGCILTDKNGKLTKFHPLLKVDDEWEETFIKENGINVCKLYKPPFNFKRSGCKGCPYALTLAEQLETMAKYLPSERKQCEVIWKPVYEEYRRLNYRLKSQMTIFDYLEENNA